MTRRISVRARTAEEAEWQLKDYALPGDIVTADAEHAYRRGFSQGASLARQFLEAGCTIEDLKEWELALLAWRRRSCRWIKGQPVLAQQPPDPKSRNELRWDNVL